MSNFTAKWDSYRAQCIPPDAHPTQYAECKRAFYSGAWATMNLLSNGTADDAQEIINELKAFRRDLEEGRA